MFSEYFYHQEIITKYISIHGLIFIYILNSINLETFPPFLP